MGAQGLPLGLFPSLSYEPPLILEVNPGDLLVLVTDGFLEWTNSQNEYFGTERLEETIRTTSRIAAASGPIELVAVIAGANLESGDSDALMLSLDRLFGLLPQLKQEEFLSKAGAPREI